MGFLWPILSGEDWLRNVGWRLALAYNLPRRGFVEIVHDFTVTSLE
jgi:hypothetical protein